jgi:hypothetical protein
MLPGVVLIDAENIQRFPDQCFFFFQSVILIMALRGIHITGLRSEKKIDTGLEHKKACGMDDYIGYDTACKTNPQCLYLTWLPG